MDYEDSELEEGEKFSDDEATLDDAIDVPEDFDSGDEDEEEI